MESHLQAPQRSHTVLWGPTGAAYGEPRF